MKPPYKMVVDDLAVVVIDAEEFNEICRTFVREFLLKHIDQAEADVFVTNCINAKYIPMVIRGDYTKHLFDRFGVEQDRMSLCARGFGVHTLSLGFGLQNPSQVGWVPSFPEVPSAENN